VSVYCYHLFHYQLSLETFGYTLVSEPKREDVAGGLRKLHNEELHNLHVSPHIIKVMESRRMRWVGYVACMGDMRNLYNSLVGKPEVKKLLRRARHRWEDNIRMDFRETGWEGVDWIHLA
jgi:hypothetical protein